MSKVIRKKDEVAITSSTEKAALEHYDSKVTSAEDKLMIAIKNLLKAYETEARNARKSK